MGQTSPFVSAGSSGGRAPIPDLPAHPGAGRFNPKRSFEATLKLQRTTLIPPHFYNEH